MSVTSHLNRTVTFFKGATGKVESSLTDLNVYSQVYPKGIAGDVCNLPIKLNSRETAKHTGKDFNAGSFKAEIYKALPECIGSLVTKLYSSADKLWSLCSHCVPFHCICSAANLMGA